MGQVVTKHSVGGVAVWALHGHLSAASIAGKLPGTKVAQCVVTAHLHLSEAILQREVCKIGNNPDMQSCHRMVGGVGGGAGSGATRKAQGVGVGGAL